MTTLAKQTRPITPQDWKDIEQKLKSFYRKVVLVCDGYELTLILERYNQYRNVISFYVNGVIEGKWHIEDCEERRRFFSPKTKSIYSPKEMAKFKKISKKMWKELAAKNKYTYYQAHWSSFRALKSHLVKNNNVIELVCENTEKGLDADGEDQD
ncbi:hypothetical protein [Paenibacillus naphthalenovorans]|uniref:hypothetical protein n=1 Tax=Paenibacillus naphthalenovorans TaxID=162209 RepID=UPI00088DF0B5|nr:hypothetical protein [Paenibacillus naphthalenovorans]SDI49901.1 hypothetical protein SAMN05421868_10747 [Paenibacillus naphthalenovorans]